MEVTDSENPSTPKQASRVKKMLTMLTLVMAGEAIFFLPFTLPRIFRATFLDVFAINNLQLGSAFSAYGIVAMVSYFIGGPLADRFAPRYLLGTALLGTSAGGFVLVTLPSYPVVVGIYAFWGLTTILLFWAALMKATREWGGQEESGQAFGWLDGGRGLMAAAVGSLGVILFASMIPSEAEQASLVERQQAFREVILWFSAIVAGVGIWVFLMLRNPNSADSTSSPRLNLGGIKRVIGMPGVWLQAIIIVCAYVAYKGTDDFSLYAREVMKYNEVDSAQIGTLSLWVRPIAAILAGFLADRFSTSRMILWSFGFMLVGSLMLASGWFEQGLGVYFMATVVGVSLGIYAMRGLYFAIMQEAKVPLAVTGSAVGLVSVLGYTPDIFMGPLMGILLDGNPGPLGHQYVFWVVAGFALLGILTALIFRKVNSTHG